MSADPWAFGSKQLIAVGVAGLAFIGVTLTATLRWRADRRDELWRRMKWAFDQCWHERASARSVGRFALQSGGSDGKQPTLAALLKKPLAVVMVLR